MYVRSVIESIPRVSNDEFENMFYLSFNFITAGCSKSTLIAKPVHAYECTVFFILQCDFSMYVCIRTLSLASSVFTQEWVHRHQKIMIYNKNNNHNLNETTFCDYVSVEAGTHTTY